jgi:hypothetical protein
VQDWSKLGRGIVLSSLQLRRLGEAGPDGRGVHCGQDGLFLAGPLARTALKAEDLRLACERLEAALTRAGWDPATHPRAGVPPNPGWFGPTGGAGEIIAQNEEEPRPEEETDPLAAVRRQMWHSELATLREIDPANAQLFVLTAPGWTPLSKSGPPAVEINLPGIAVLKIHFP